MWRRIIPDPLPPPYGQSSPSEAPTPCSAPQKVLDLVEVYDRNADAYESAAFKEAELRQQFVNPLFACLGWDMDNEQGNAEAYKDVVHEAAIKIGGAPRRRITPSASAARPSSTWKPRSPR